MQEFFRVVGCIGFYLFYTKATKPAASFPIAVDANEVVIEALSADSCLKVDIALGVLSIFAIEQKGRPPIGVLLICIFIAQRFNAD